MTTAKPVLTFSDLTPNAIIGQHIDVFDQKMADRWKSIFINTSNGSSDDGALRASIAVVLAMRAMLLVAAPRPPGNVHARQYIKTYALPKLNETVISEVSCLHKEIKRERRYVDFGVVGKSDDGHPIYEARMSLIWAA